jgi:Fe-S cluster biosynthesis and repair protein YggX
MMELYQKEEEQIAKMRAIRIVEI